VREWLAKPRQKRWHLHFTPTSASWLNLIEGWFSVLNRKALTNTNFTSTRQLEEAIDVWASHWNDDPQPFAWTKNVDDIITKVKRERATLDRVAESAT
jgi:transposase